MNIVSETTDNEINEWFAKSLGVSISAFCLCFRLQEVSGRLVKQEQWER